MGKEVFWKKKDIYYYGLAVLVCIIHLFPLYNYSYLSPDEYFIAPYRWFRRAVTGGAVPSFFFFSGVLFFRDYIGFESYIKKIKSRIHTLLIPYLSWNIIGTIFGIITTIFFSQYFIKRPPSDISFVGILKSIFLYTNNGQFWFIFFLMIFVAASPFVYLLVKNKYFGAMVIAVSIILTNWIGLPCFVPECGVYFIAGAYIGLNWFDWFAESNNTKSILGLLSVIIVCLFRSFDFAFDFIPVRTVLYLIFALGSFFSMGFFDTYLTHHTAPSFVHHSFLVFALHLNCNSVIGKLLFFILPKSIFFAWVNFFATLILTLAFVELFAKILYKVSPNLFFILSGSKK